MCFLWLLLCLAATIDIFLYDLFAVKGYKKPSVKQYVKYVPYLEHGLAHNPQYSTYLPTNNSHDRQQLDPSQARMLPQGLHSTTDR